MVAADHHEVLGGPSVGLTSILVRLLHGSLTTAVIVESSLTGVCTAHGRLPFTCAVGVTILVPRKLF